MKATFTVEERKSIVSVVNDHLLSNAILIWIVSAGIIWLILDEAFSHVSFGTSVFATFLVVVVLCVAMISSHKEIKMRLQP